MLKATKKYIIVEPKEQDKVTDSGIILPDKKEQSKSGIVIDIGGSEPEYSVGDTVIYKEWNVVDYIFEGKNYLIIKKEDIISYLK